MKKLFLIFPILCACANGQEIAPVASAEKSESSAVQKYRAQIKTCDDIADKEFDNPDNSTTVGISMTINNQIECYKAVAYEIIDKGYSTQSESMKKTMDDYIYLSGSLMGMTLRPDSCYPYCGTIVGNHSAAYALKHARDYLDILIDGDPNGKEQ